MSIGGAHALYRATVLEIRARFPRIVIQYMANERGETHPLALPRPVTAYVHAGLVQEA